MALSATTTKQMDKQGRVVIPEEVRETLDIDGEAAIVELEVTCRKRIESEE